MGIMLGIGGENGLVARDGIPGHPFTDAQGGAAQRAPGQTGAGLEAEGTAVWIQQVNGAGINLHHLGRLARDQVQRAVQIPGRTERPRDFTQCNYGLWTIRDTVLHKRIIDKRQ
jgi:hypothetical protein